MSQPGRGHSSSLLSISEIVERYGVARKTVMRWLEAGKIVPAKTLPGRTGLHLFRADDAEFAFGGWRGSGSRSEAAGESVAEVAPELERDTPMLLLPYWWADAGDSGMQDAGSISPPDWPRVLAGLRDWLSNDVKEALGDSWGPISPSRVESEAVFWESGDLRGTEARIRELVALRDAGQVGVGYRLPVGVLTIDELLIRAIFEQGRHEECLTALSGVINMGCPYWLLQIQFLSVGRLASLIGVPRLAFESYWRSLDVPLNGGADVDYLLRSLYGLATTDTSWLAGVPRPAEWAQLALDFGGQIQADRGLWYDAAVREELQEIARRTGA